MALETKRKEKETAQSLLHRFTKSVQQSGILVRARKKRFKDREKSKMMQKKAALRREEIKKKYAKLKKLGKPLK